jgi:hypothetical protein
MYNRYVDGLAAETPQDQLLYDEMGARMARVGYVTKPAESSPVESLMEVGAK